MIDYASEAESIRRLPLMSQGAIWECISVELRNKIVAAVLAAFEVPGTIDSAEMKVALSLASDCPENLSAAYSIKANATYICVHRLTKAGALVAEPSGGTRKRYRLSEF